MNLHRNGKKSSMKIDQVPVIVKNLDPKIEPPILDGKFDHSYVLNHSFSSKSRSYAGSIIKKNHQCAICFL